MYTCLYMFKHRSVGQALIETNLWYLNNMKFQVIRNCYVLKVNVLSYLLERTSYISINWERAIDALNWKYYTLKLNLIVQLFWIFGGFDNYGCEEYGRFLNLIMHLKLWARFIWIKLKKGFSDKKISKM